MADQQSSTNTPTLEALLAAGVHFGHQTRRWNPKMRRFIFAERNGIHIIDLQKTMRQIEVAQKLARDVVLRGENVLFVCTKPQLAGMNPHVDRASACSSPSATRQSAHQHRR
jgi:small subunit ribosomal protein S2